jgi:hypothetical protein
MKHLLFSIASLPFSLRFDFGFGNLNCLPFRAAVFFEAVAARHGHFYLLASFLRA